MWWLSLCLERKRRSLSGVLRPSVNRGRLYLISVTRAQNTPPPHKRTHAERARPPPPPRARIRPRPEPPTAGASRDKHPHPLSCCARQQISQEPTKEFTKATPGVTIVLSHPPPNIHLYQAGLY
ncbi:hypothetical protein DPMN_093458 [Dreissena polymorpha]|uniref:Uncharacterized protein n=1 Tax=Dreissena polymorpha TaxID=45954 RepID=A0A9D4R1X1_DREPO|nr:hypothetical protein DPMN_093458 [Dreissena polymorpha]